MEQERKTAVAFRVPSKMGLPIAYLAANFISSVQRGDTGRAPVAGGAPIAMGAAQVEPEPASLLLVASALAAIALVRRRVRT